jgi:uncharacterized protein DUF222
MSDVMALASHAHHYLAIFDNGRAIGLYHTKRLASVSAWCGLRFGEAVELRPKTSHPTGRLLSVDRAVCVYSAVKGSLIYQQIVSGRDAEIAADLSKRATAVMKPNDEAVLSK